MEKNKGRVDMLAAGRKKLQQYRQKKDGKPSGKSAKKSTKHDHPADSSSKPDSSQLPQGDIAAPPDDSSSTLHSTDSLMLSQQAIASDTSDVATLLPSDAPDSSAAQEPPSTVIEGAHDADANMTTETVSSDQQNRMDEPDSVTALEGVPVKLETETTIEDKGRDSLPTEEYMPDSTVPSSSVIEGAQDADANNTTETVSSDQQNRIDEPDSSVTALDEAPVKLETEIVIEDEGRDSLPTEESTARGDELQQYRQEKDGKESAIPMIHGHPVDSSKLDETKASTDSSQIPERDIAALDDSSTLHSIDSLMLSQHAIASIDPSSEMGGVVSLLANDAQLAQEPATLQQDDADSSVPPSSVIEGAQDFDANRTTETVSSVQQNRMDGVLNESDSVPALEETSVPSSEIEGAQNADANRTTETVSSDQQDRMDEPDSVTALEGVPVKLETETVIEDEGRDPLPTKDYIPDTSSFTARGDQVTDGQCRRPIIWVPSNLMEVVEHNLKSLCWLLLLNFMRMQKHLKRKLLEETVLRGKASR